MPKYKGYNLSRKGIVKCVKIRRSDIPGDFYYSWVIYIYRSKGDAIKEIESKKQELMITPNPDKEYSSILAAFQSAKKYMEDVIRIPIISSNHEVIENFRYILNRMDKTNGDKK